MGDVGIPEISEYGSVDSAPAQDNPWIFGYQATG